MKHFSSSVVQPILAAVRPSTIVEIGAEAGGHTTQLVRWAEEHDARLHVIDPAPGSAVRALARQHPDACVLHKGLSLEALPRIERPDVVLIDGDHNWYTVYEELRLIERRSARWPVTLLHDVSWPWGRRDLYYSPKTVPEEWRQPFGTGGIVRGQSPLSADGGFGGRRAKALHEGGPRNGVLTAVEDFMRVSELDLQFFAVPGPGGLGMLFERARLDDDRALAEVVEGVHDPAFAVRLTPGYASRYFDGAAQRTPAIELRWPSGTADHEYRVLLRDDTDGRYVIKQAVGAPPYGLRPETLDPSHLYRWRVQGRDREAPQWRNLFPDLLLPEDPRGAGPGLRTAVSAPVRAQALLTWDGVGAPAYRVMIRDDETKDVVSNDAIQGTAYAVDWSKLDPRRLWGYRVQALKEGGWADLVKYRTLHPPVELLGNGDLPPSEPDVSFTHVILTRFSLRTSGVGFRGEWEPGWLEHRLELFERYCLPSVLSQTSQDFTWVVFCDPATPGEIVDRLRGYSERITVADCRRTSGLRGNHPDDLRDLDPYIDPDAKVVISTRLDSDDALNRGAIAQIQRHAGAFWGSSEELLLHSFPLGCKFDAVNGLVYRSRYQQNAFLSLFERPGNNVQGVMRDSHTRLEKLCPLERDFSLLGWLQVLHGGNVSNHLTRQDVQADDLDLDALFGVAGP